MILVLPVGVMAPHRIDIEFHYRTNARHSSPAENTPVIVRRPDGFSCFRPIVVVKVDRVVVISHRFFFALVHFLDGASIADASDNPEFSQPSSVLNTKQVPPEHATRPSVVAPEEDWGDDNTSAPRHPAPMSEIQELTFDDLKCNMQQDVVFRPWMLTERAKELDGGRIRVAGFMLPHLQREGITEFMLLRNVECKFGPGGKADHLVRVILQEGITTQYHGDRPLDVVGTLKINPFQGTDGNTWCIYDLEGESVEWNRR